MLDVEACSLHGLGFAVCAVVAERETGKIVDKFELCAMQGVDLASQWVKENVIPALENMRKCHEIRSLRTVFYEFYMKYRGIAEIWSDCNFPVETNFFSAILADDPTGREWNMPYPLYDLSTLMDVDIDRNAGLEVLNLRKHHPLDDAIASLHHLMAILESQKSK